MNYKEMYEQAIERVKIRFGINVAAELFPELSESEDERIRKAISRLINTMLTDKDIESENVTKVQIDNWLEKQGKQEPVKLSEEDETIKTIKCALLSCCKGSLFNYELSYDGYEKCLSRLASLIPQNRWKPSDRELGAILVAIGDERQKGSDTVKELLNIYQHLKKLREEDSTNVYSNEKS